MKSFIKLVLLIAIPSLICLAVFSSLRPLWKKLAADAQLPGILTKQSIQLERIAYALEGRVDKTPISAYNLGNARCADIGQGRSHLLSTPSAPNGTMRKSHGLEAKDGPRMSFNR